MVLTNDELGAYRNSEIAMKLIAMMEDEACACEDEDSHQVEIELSKDDDGNLVIEVEKTELDDDSDKKEKIGAELSLGLVREKLGTLAKQAGASGNVKAAYLIERVIDDLVL